MPIIRRKLDANTVYPTNIRYNSDTDTVQSLVNDEWVDNPAADPRHQTTLPPRITSNPACDAAQSVVDALKGQINGIVEAIDNSATLFTIAGIILSIFTFGVYAIFVSLAIAIGGDMVTAGSAAITAALTDPIWDTLKCILQCHMTPEGRMKDGELTDVYNEVNDQIGGLGATIINSMLALAGEGGINNLASLGTSTGDCDECGCVCGFVTNNATGNWDRWQLLDVELYDWSGIALAFNTDDSTKMFADGYGTVPNQVLSAMTEFDEPCLVDQVFLYNLGTMDVQRMVVGWRTGGVWTTVLNEVATNHNGAVPWIATVGDTVDAIGYQYLDNSAQITSVTIA